MTNKSSKTKQQLFSSIHSKDQSNDFCQTLLYCQELLANSKIKKRKIKKWQPNLTPEEKELFDHEELLSPYQHIIANTCGQHRYQLEQNRTATEPLRLPIHHFCRKGVYPSTSTQRQQIEDDQVPWTVDLPNYNPPYYTHPSLLKTNTVNTDPESISSNFIWNTFDTNSNVDRRTANPTGHYPIDKNGYPLNPLGRTGLRGRGQLKRWAVNYQTHIVILCGTNEIKSGKEIFKYLMEKSKDNYFYHLPSTWTTGTNMEAIKKTLRTYLFDIYQLWNNFKENSKTKINQIIEHLTFVSTAYIDDTRNTDNAWLETSVCCYIQTNLNKDLSSNLDIDLNELFPDQPLTSNINYTWHQVTRSSKLLESERDVIKLIAKRYNAYW